jgi:uncharacterized membrane protein YeaQ/YmgE (transglycosylase-associated protein family)
MEVWGALILLVCVLLVGLAAYAIPRPENDYAWVYDAIGAFIGGFVASEFLSTWGWEVNGLFAFPALISAVVVGLIVDLVFRATFGMHRPAPHAQRLDYRVWASSSLPRACSPPFRVGLWNRRNGDGRGRRVNKRRMYGDMSTSNVVR